MRKKQNCDICISEGGEINQTTSRPSSSNDVGSAESSNQSRPRPTPPSASRRKIGELAVGLNDAESEGDVNIIVSLGILSQSISNFCVCKYCLTENSLHVKEEYECRKGLACKLLIECGNCEKTFPFWTSPKLQECYDINIRCVFGLRSIGKGNVSGKTLFGLMDSPSPPQRFERYNPILLRVLNEVATQSMVDATEEAVQLNTYDTNEERYRPIDDPRDIGVGIDGTWQKRGFSSPNGVVSVSSIDSGKILDVNILTKYCHTSKVSLDKSHFCSKHFEGSSGSMEVDGAVTLFARSKPTRNVQYRYYFGDGNTKGFQKVVDSQPYGETFVTQKLECVGHVQKRMGTRLRKLRKDRLLVMKVR